MPSLAQVRAKLDVAELEQRVRDEEADEEHLEGNCRRVPIGARRMRRVGRLPES